MHSVKYKINRFSRSHTFEVFGYDFIIDAELKPWLIEVNTNPCIEESSPLLGQLIPRMLDDGLKITLDLMTNSKSEGVFQVDDYADEENMWESLG